MERRYNCGQGDGIAEEIGTLLTFLCAGLETVWAGEWHVSLWEAGFLYEKGPLRQAFRWDQIESVQGQALYVPQVGSTLFIYKVRCQDGCEVKFTNVFQNCSQLIDPVLECLAQTVMDL